MTAPASNSPDRGPRGRRAGPGLDRDALSASGELPGGRDRLPRASARPLARDAGARAGDGAGLHAGLVRAEPVRGSARRRRAASRGGAARRGAGRGIVAVLRMRDGAVAKHVGVLAASALGHRDADPCLFRPRRGRVAADAGLVPADRRGFPLSREERLMATLLLSAAGSALGGALGGSVAGLGTAVLGKAIGATLGVGDRPAAARHRLGAGGDRAGRAVPRDGIERGGADCRGSSAVHGSPGS